MVFELYINFKRGRKEGKEGGRERKKERKGKEKEKRWRASLVAQWLRICLPIQGTQVRALVQEDTTCRGATKPVCHNY